jgi:coproporphyrinogen III oxidase
VIKREDIAAWFMQLQDAICNELSAIDGTLFIEESWDREQGGGGRTRVLQNGVIIEKGGVNFSAVHGEIPEFLLREHKEAGNQNFYATGLSIVLHPRNPWVPIIHMNTRYFELGDNTKWFGGGIDVSPHYVDTTDVIFLHQSLKAVCDRFDPAYYNEYKRWADTYFYIPHRKETRGIGGIFFDRLKASPERSLEDRFEFVRALGNAFIPIYSSLIKKHKDKSYGENEKNWQYLRRGRYAEFNLVYDKGTKFGLETNGRIESILMSLPPQANWTYNYIPKKGSLEEATLLYLQGQVIP